MVDYEKLSEDFGIWLFARVLKVNSRLWEKLSQDFGTWQWYNGFEIKW